MRAFRRCGAVDWIGGVACSVGVPALAMRRLAVAAGATVAAVGVMPSAAQASGVAAGPCGANGIYWTDGSSSSCTYTTVGEDTFAVPADVGQLQVVTVGGAGGAGGSSGYGASGGAGGKGAKVSGSLAVGTWSVLYVQVGSAGASAPAGAYDIGNTCAPGAGGLNGGAHGGNARCFLGGGGGGGGASDVRISPLSISTLTADANDPRLVVAGGGGGGGGASSLPGGAGGSSGGSATTGAGDGADMTCPPPDRGPAGEGNVGAGGGSGGTGQAGIGCIPANGSDGVAGAGGVGGNGDPPSAAGGGGGGGGFFGGGGGGAITFAGGGGGGGGSSYGPAGATYEATADPPSVTISWTEPATGASCDATLSAVGCWAFDETTGPTALDASPFANNGTYVGNPVLGVPGVDETAVRMDGIDDYVRVPDSASLDVGDSFTLEGWIKRTSTTHAQQLFNKGTNGLQLMVMGNANQNQVWLRKAGVTTIARSTGGVPADCRYHHIVATKNGPASARIYIDGQPSTDPALTSPQPVANTATPLIFSGANPTTSHDIDEFAVYDQALTAQQVNDRYEATYVGIGCGGA